MKTIDSGNHPSLPVPDDNSSDDSSPNEAANLIRTKLDTIYGHEPDVIGEAIESERIPSGKRSKHQKFMAELAESGKPFIQIQTDWHEYYKALTNKEKHEVWNEFYDNQSNQSKFKPKSTNASVLPAATPDSPFVGSFDPPEDMATERRPGTVADIKKQLSGKVKVRGKLKRNQNLKSLGFGLSMGLLMLFILMFGFFNQRVIAPFITPSKTVSSTPIILDPDSPVVGTDPKLIIPKINVELPIVTDVQTVDESAVQDGLEEGVVHYATTSLPGEKGNGAIFGHSSNNILNRGNYKFAFVLLSRLESGDTFYIEYEGTRYVYKIFDKQIVKPTDTYVLNDVSGKTSTFTLITCDPPGTDTNRLVVWGEQVSPNPNDNSASTAVKTDDTPPVLASNSPSLWSRITGWIF